MKRDKMRYALQSMKIAEAILQLKIGSFFKRAIARLILMRIPDFITFARGFNNDLKGVRSPLEYKKVKGELNALFQLYVEYMSNLRHEFAGHFKDADFFERIEDWGQIQEDSLLFFIQHADEIAAQLDPFHQTSITLDPHEAALIQGVSVKHDLENSPRLGNDILALTRFNTGGMIHLGDLQTKPAMINSLRIILDYESALLKVLTQRELISAVKTLVVVDVINFSDILFTRPIQAGAVQEMDGMDTIVSKYGIQKAIDLFEEAKLKTRMLQRIDQIRHVRNIICAHIDGPLPMADLYNRLDGLSTNEIIGLYEHMCQLFEKICKSDNRLSISQLPNTPLRRVLGFSHQPSTAYDRQSVPPTEFDFPDYDEPTMNAYWGKLLAGVEIEEGIEYFNDAFTFSPELEDSVTRNIVYEGNMEYREEHRYRLAHKFIDIQFSENRCNIKYLNILHRIITFNNIGSSPVLVKILLREYELYADDNSKKVILDMLSKLSDMNEVKVIDLLKREANSRGFELRSSALHALVQLDLRNNGERILNRRQVRSNINLFVLQQIETLTTYQKIIFCFICLSYLHLNGKFAVYSSYSQDKYCSPLEAILRKYVPRIVSNTRLSRKDKLEILILINNRNYCRASLLIGDALEYTDTQKSRTFYSIIADGDLFIVSSQNTLLDSRALALQRLGRYKESLETIDYLIHQNPLSKEYRFLSLEVSSYGKLVIPFQEQVERLQQDFCLDSVDLVALDQLRKRCYSKGSF